MWLWMVVLVAGMEGRFDECELGMGRKYLETAK